MPDSSLITLKAYATFLRSASESSLSYFSISIFMPSILKIVLYQIQQLPINRLRCVDITIEIDVPCPPGPSGLFIGEGIEATGIHIANAKALCKIIEIFFKPLPAVCKTRGSGKPAPAPTTIKKNAELRLSQLCIQLHFTRIVSEALRFYESTHLAYQSQLYHPLQGQ